MKFAKTATVIVLAALLLGACGTMRNPEGQKITASETVVSETAVSETAASKIAATESAAGETASTAENSGQESTEVEAGPGVSTTEVKTESAAETTGQDAAAKKTEPGAESAGQATAEMKTESAAETVGQTTAMAAAEPGESKAGESGAEDGKNEQSSQEPSALEESIETETETMPVSAHENKLICIDPGHQKHQNSEKEPDGPGSDTMKMKVSSGTSGRWSGLDEYELNMQVSEKLKLELQDRGYLVIMTHDDADVDISNSERAEIANEAGADAFIRIHADGSDSSKDEGAMTICQTRNNPYNADIYEECYALSSDVIEEMQAEMDCKSRGVWKTDSMSGINWCQVPVTIVEMGFMSNKKEDLLMASDDYQYKIVRGIANGLDRFFDKMN